MQIDLEKIKKLPADVRKEFMKMYLQLEDKKREDKVKKDFLAFVKHMWPDFIEGYHHKIIAEKFNQMADGKIKRLIVNMPQHTLESSPLGSVVKQKILSIVKSFKKYLRQDCKKIVKPLVAGKLHKVASISQQGSGVLLQDGARIY